MGRQLIAFLAGGALVGSVGLALAHHSFAMFDTDNQLELVGEVQEFKIYQPAHIHHPAGQGDGRCHNGLEP